MAFAVEDFHDLVRLLEQHPEWRAELRRLVLSEELLSLPDSVKELVHAQRRTEERVSELAEAQRRTEERLHALDLRLEQLAEAQRRTEERLSELAEAQRRTEERLQALDLRLEQLAEAQRRTEVEIQRLVRAQEETAERLRQTDQRLAGVLGSDLERRYRERAADYFQDLLRRIRVIDHESLGFELDDAVDAGRISRQERTEALRVDVVVQGRLDAEETYLAVEVSSTVDDYDVRRAAERAAILAKATGWRVIPAVAGSELAANVVEEAARRNVRCFLDGRLVDST